MQSLRFLGLKRESSVDGKVRHVDIFSNDPLAGSRQLLAKVQMNGAPELELIIEPDAKTDDKRMWSFLCSRVGFDPKSNPKGFLEALPQSIDATYVAATEVHDEADCPFADAPYVRE
jgi:hypothetical protein